MAYAGGLRISELINLKILDIDRERMVINIRQAKGKKDRIVMLSEKLLIMLREYYSKYLPKVWLFEGASGEEYSTRSISKIFQQCKSKANITKKGGIHSFRHSFATHLYEGGKKCINSTKGSRINVLFVFVIKNCGTLSVTHFIREVYQKDSEFYQYVSYLHVYMSSSCEDCCGPIIL